MAAEWEVPAMMVWQWILVGLVVVVLAVGSVYVQTYLEWRKQQRDGLQRKGDKTP
jgi:hypothetical protein